MASSVLYRLKSLFSFNFIFFRPVDEKWIRDSLWASLTSENDTRVSKILNFSTSYSYYFLKTHFLNSLSGSKYCMTDSSSMLQVPNLVNFPFLFLIFSELSPIIKSSKRPLGSPSPFYLISTTKKFSFPEYNI